MKFLKCRHCGNVATKLYDSGVNIVCCGEDMQLIEPNTVDAATEKHVPVLSLDKDILTVKIGSVDHPMIDEHYIVFVAVDNGGILTVYPFKPSDKPEAKICVDPSKPIEVYEYCNIHGLWSAKL